MHVDARNEKEERRIREHAMQKVPFQLVLGDREMESREVNVRVRAARKKPRLEKTGFARCQVCAKQPGMSKTSVADRKSRCSVLLCKGYHHRCDKIAT